MQKKLIRTLLLGALLVAPVFGNPLKTRDSQSSFPHAWVVVHAPFVSGLPGLDAVVKSHVDRMVATFASEVKDLGPRKERYFMGVSPQVAEQDGPWVSVLLEGLQDFHGAHPAHQLESILYNQREWQLSDLFQPHTTYLAALSNYCFDYLNRKEIGDPTWNRHGAAPEPKNFRLFTVHNGRLIIWFEPYQVASYGAGTIEVVIPHRVVEPYLAPGGPLHP